jgi:exosortase/archaeosortase family protein
VQTTLIFSAALVLLTLPLAITFSSMLTSLATYTGLDKAVSIVVPYEAGAVADLLRGVGLAAGSGANSVWLAGGFIPLTAFIDWNCAGWQGFALFGLTSVFGLPDVRSNWRRVAVLALGLAGVFAVNVLRIFLVVLLGYFSGYQAALIFHNYGGAILTLVWLLIFWTLVLRGENRTVPDGA